MINVTNDRDQVQNSVSPEFSEVVAKVSAQLQAGESISWETIRQQYPQFEQELRQVIPALEGLVALGIDDSESAKVSDLIGGEEVTPNRTLGDFQIIREIGRGGMGVVYEAEQLSIKRSVALKVLPFAALVDSRAIQRFKNEVTAVATLEHPHIVSVYAVGEERGIHYYAMRLIRGQSLASVIHELQKKTRAEDSLDGDSISQVVAALPASGKGSFDVPEATRTFDSKIQADLSTAAKGRSVTAPSKVTDQNYFRNVVGLIIQAGDALHHAHQQGIIHRDVKPGNLLLDAGSQLFVTDFGLARIENAPELTLTGDFMGTLRYMSPEQVQAGRVMIDHRTDIYSLGATLYELLTLAPIWSDKNKTDLIRRISLEEPNPPRKINPAIPVDLETIVLKSLRRNPNERYASAREFADDLQRFLDYETIKAKRPTTMERINKWTRRNPTILWASVAVLILLTVASIASTFLILEQKKIAHQKSEDALKESQYAQAITDFVKNDFLALTSVEGQEEFDDYGEFELNRNTTLRELLDRAAIKLDARSDLDPRIEAELRWMIGENYLGMSEYRRAIEFLEEALHLHRVAYGDEAEETLIAQHSLAEAYENDGQYDRAILLYEETWHSRRYLLGEDNKDTLESMAGLARMTEAAGESDAAVPFWERLIELRKAKLGERHRDTIASMWSLVAERPGMLYEVLPLMEQAFQETKAELGEDHRDTLDLGSDLCQAYRLASKNSEAIKLSEQLVKLANDKLGDDHAATFTFMNNLALIYAENLQADKAIQIQTQLAEKIQSKLGEDHPDTLQVKNNLAWALVKDGRLGEALALRNEVLARMRQVLGEDHPKTLSAMDRVAALYGDLRQHAMAVQVREDVLELSKLRLGMGHRNTLVRMRILAETYHEAGEFEKAEPLWVKTIETIKAELASDQPLNRGLVATVSDLGWAYRFTERFEEAILAFEQAVEMSRELWGNNHPFTLLYMSRLGDVYGKAGQHDKEVQMFEQLGELVKERHGEDSSQFFEFMSKLSEAYGKAGQLKDEVRLSEQMAELAKGYHGQDSYDFFTSKKNLAEAYEHDGRYDQAIRLWTQLVENRTSVLGANNGETLYMMRELAESYRYAGRLAEAQKWLEEILEIHIDESGKESPETLYCMRLLGETYGQTHQTDKSIPLLKRLVELSEVNLGGTHTDTLDVRRALAESYKRADRLDEAIALLEEVVEASAAYHGKRNQFTWWCAQHLADAYLEANEFKNAESLLQTYLANVENVRGWFAPNTMSMLGEALAGQEKFPEAEQLLLAGYHGLAEEDVNKIMPLLAHCHTDSLERLVKLYESWDQAKPDQGYKAKAAQWQRKFDEHNAEALSESSR